MSRSLSSAALPAVFARETDAAFLVLLTVSHDGLDPASLRFILGKQTYDIQWEPGAQTVLIHCNLAVLP